jgi:hypothetical protein
MTRHLSLFTDSYGQEKIGIISSLFCLFKTSAYFIIPNSLEIINILKTNHATKMTLPQFDW